MKNYKNVPYYTFGEGSIADLKEILEAKRNGLPVVFMVDDFFTDKKIEEKLPVEGKDMVIFVSTETEPHSEYIDELTAEVKAKAGLPSAIIGMGGGTVMDIAKCVSIMLTNPGKAEDYQGWDLVKKPGIFKIGIPTISGTGAESSRTGIFTSPRVKLGMNSDYSMFDQIILDPQFLKTVPTDKFIFTAMDCYAHDVELLKSNNCAFTKALAGKSLELMREVFLNKMDYEKLMIASYLGGAAMATASGGHVCHPVSYGLSLVLGMRHGFATALSFNYLGEYYPEEIDEFKGIVKKFGVKFPENIMKDVSEEQLDIMAEATLKNEKPLKNAFGENWREIFTKEKVKDILRKM